MSKQYKSCTASKVIEIHDSSDEEPANTSESNIKNLQRLKSVFISTSGSNPQKKDATQTQDKSYSSSSDPKKSDEFDIRKKIINRRKSVHHSIRSTEDFSFEFNTRKRRESVDDVSSQLNKKKPCNKSQIDDAVDRNLKDPETEQMLKRIAYCRVFSNYLLRNYDMLGINFKLYSNLDRLNLDLKMRVDTYKKIKKSRERLRNAREMNNGQIQL